MSRFEELDRDLGRRVRTALVTGANRGIGSAIADRLAMEGLRVLRPGRGELDLQDPLSIEAFCTDHAGHVDVLVNNAGINPLTSIGDLTPVRIWEVLQTNLVAAMLLTSRLAPAMAVQGWGRIVNISSVWSMRARPNRGIYAASKAGLEAFTRATAAEFGGAGILANAVAPGFIDTELTRANLSLSERSELAGLIPVNRLGTVEEIARVVSFLASESNTFVTGQSLTADGGFACRG